MIGNDIVDLALAKKESNWQRPGFLEKIFTNKEQLLILNAENPEIMVWNLWSRKEAAYKIYNRQTGIRAYIPLQLECNYETASSGSVCCKGNIYYTKTEVSKDKISTVAVSRICDFKAIKELQANVQVYKKNGIPYVNDAKNVLKPISISHHGRFISRVSVA
ncbi:4'-phosphopantetheinyl transferase family protein [Flavobacterium degerlachei]|jgi:phosphopantetheinyl transferase (holo-ACP synthase)|uniref:4'-phosphopantetheinyl transferase superfamily protein n=1 Tax=Flavobacterium degerlachei TaxID=229203 RepID=A0A1H3EXT6_9FLAO|nr:4'-phosphopantetheinyl transferase superfamily protein [Flavobacterium degerlachei]SDX82789.1 4'-phosphopantetheinyl transferase superfamily protein [Flavobacterium degerlachei]